MSKGIMFSVIIFFLAVTLVGLIVIQRSLVSYRREQMFIETRISAINNHYDSVVRDLGKTIETITQRAIIACINNISLNFVPLKNANVIIKELIINGTLDGNRNFMMDNATVSYWVEQIKDVSTLKGFDLDINTDLINKTLIVKPYNSFYLLVEADTWINITDMQGVSVLNKTTQISKTISIEGLEDPLYLLYFKGLSSNYVWESPYVGNYTQLLLTGTGNGLIYGAATKNEGNKIGKILVLDNANGVDLSGAIGVISKSDINPDPSIPFLDDVSAIDVISEGQNILLDGTSSKVWYIENFKKHLEGRTTTEEDHSYYQTSDNGPSYLDRLEGRYSIDSKYSSPGKTIGLESFVDKTIFPGGFSPVQERTNIDYLYFSGTLNGDRIKGISTDYNWFRVDTNHQQNYTVDQLAE